MTNDDSVQKKREECRMIATNRFSYMDSVYHLQIAQLSQRDSAAGWVSCGQKWNRYSVT